MFVWGGTVSGSPRAPWQENTRASFQTTHALCQALFRLQQPGDHVLYRSHVIEEREYRFLGQWVEGDVTYTYKERRDQATYECFAVEVVDDNEIFIMEAGVNC
ncbi:hypothetical protein O3P69_017569 [Scylla paramamosain]|uniref:DUF7045 domain-containing protein n=1 Tax=Scylla paramamosain TaxID=85552 RepID=A0AAW0TWW2_SCYPA